MWTLADVARNAIRKTSVNLADDDPAPPKLSRRRGQSATGALGRRGCLCSERPSVGEVFPNKMVAKLRLEGGGRAHQGKTCEAEGAAGAKTQYRSGGWGVGIRKLYEASKSTVMEGELTGQRAPCHISTT